MTTANKRGGARPGAGRKSLPPAERKQAVAFRLSPDLITRLRASAKEREQTPTQRLTDILEQELNKDKRTR